jgi:acetyltransferase-like isoleucine patch superfamily enzyme
MGMLLFPSYLKAALQGTRFRGISRIHIHSSAHVGRHCLIDARSYGKGYITVGMRSEIHDFTRLETFGGQITIGDDCSINCYSVIYGHGGLTIGNKVRIATGCVIIPANHSYVDPNVPIMLQPETRRGISIQDDVWIGARVVILDGVCIAKGAVIGAGSIVTHDVKTNTVVAGSPACLIRYR